MTLSIGGVLLVLLAPLLVGAGVLRLLGIGFTTDRLAFAGWAWLSGTFVTAVVTLVWVLTGKPIDGRWLAPAVGLAGLATLVAAHRRPVHAPERSAAAAPLETAAFAAVVAVLALVILLRILAANTEVVVTGDEASIWAGKAKALFYSEDQGLDFLRRLRQLVIHSDYPMFNPLLQVWVFAGADSIVHVDNRLPIQAFVLAGLMVMAASLRRLVRPALAAALLAVFFGQRVVLHQAGVAEADFMVAFGVLVSLDAWLRWTDDRSAVYWRLMCLGLAATVWSKNEGIMLAVVMCIAAGLARVAARVGPVAPSPRRELVWLALPVAVVVLTEACNASWGVMNDMFNPKLGGSIWQRIFDHLGDRILPVASHFGHELITDGLLTTVFFAFVLSHPVRLLGTRIAVLVLFLTGALAAYTLIFVSTPYPLKWHLVTAAYRCVSHVAPASALGLALGAARLFPVVSRGRDPAPTPELRE